MKKKKGVNTFATDISYSSRETLMNEEQQGLFNEINKELSYISNAYDKYPRIYSAETLVQILRDQTKAKLESGMLLKDEGEEVNKKIDLFEKSLDL